MGGPFDPPLDVRGLIGLKPKDAIKAKTVSQKMPHFSRPVGINREKNYQMVLVFVIFLLLVSLKVAKEEQQTLFGLLRYIDLVLR